MLDKYIPFIIGRKGWAGIEKDYGYIEGHRDIWRDVNPGFIEGARD